MALYVPQVMVSQFFTQVKRQSFRHLLVAGLSVIILVSLLLNFRPVSSKIEKFIPSSLHVQAGSSPEQPSAREPLFADVFNATLGVRNAFHSPFTISDLTDRFQKFEKVYVVSLPERTDHRDGLLLASKVSEIDIEYIGGVRWENISKKVLPGEWNEDLHPGDVGAWRGHMNAMAESVLQL